MSFGVGVGVGVGGGGDGDSGAMSRGECASSPLSFDDRDVARAWPRAERVPGGAAGVISAVVRRPRCRSATAMSFDDRDVVRRRRGWRR